MTVQLPVYNEVYVVERLIDACVRLDYPPERSRSRCSTIPPTRPPSSWPRWSPTGSASASTSGTSAAIGGPGSRRAPWRRAGVGARDADRDLRRRLRAAAGLPDERPSPVLAADPGLAFVQARWGHVNRDDSLLTSLQALAVDGHFAVEQQARAAGGYWFNFNGTAGIWRRDAIVDAGGWRDDTLTEDLDISYRALLRGWRAAYLGGLVVPGELPVSINAYRRQQHRWARGSFECSFRHLPTIWRSAASLPMKVEATLHLTGYSIHLLMLALALLYPLVLIGALRSRSSCRWPPAWAWSA